MNRSLRTMAGLAALLTATLWLATGLAALGAEAWLFELFTHFRLQYAALFGLSLLVLVAARRWLPALIAAAGLLLHGTVLMSAAAAEHGPSATGNGPQLRVVSFNAWSGESAVEHVPAFLADIDADVVVLQQVEPQWIEPLAAALPDYPQVFDGASSQRHGVVVFSRRPFVDTAAYGLLPGGARAASVRIDVAGRMVTILSSHLQWPLNPRQARARNTEARSLGDIAAHEPGPLIVMGDLNMTRWSPYFQPLMARGQLTQCAAGVLLATWPAPLGLAGIGIDHCLVKGPVRAVAVRTGPFLWSDHYPLVADFELAAPAAG